MTDVRRTITAWRLALWVWLDCRARHVARMEAHAPLVPEWRRVTTDGTAAIMRQAELGCRPDRSRSPADHDWQGATEPERLPADAAAVHAWAEAGRRPWLVQCAERGAPPDWDPGPLAAVPVLRGGRPEVVTATVRYGRPARALVAVQYCPIDYSGTLEDHADAQGLYADLIADLEALAAAAPTLGLVAHRVVTIGLPRAPWQGLWPKSA